MRAKLWPKAAEARVYFHVARGGLEAWAMDGMMGSRLVVFVATRLPPSFNLDPAKFLLLNIRWIIPRVAALSKPEAAWLAGPEEELPAQRCRVAVAMRSSVEAPIRPAPDASMTVWKIAGRPMEVAGDLSRLFQWTMQQKVNPFLFAVRGHSGRTVQRFCCRAPGRRIAPPGRDVALTTCQTDLLQAKLFCKVNPSTACCVRNMHATHRITVCKRAVSGMTVCTLESGSGLLACNGKSDSDVWFSTTFCRNARRKSSIS